MIYTTQRWVTFSYKKFRKKISDQWFLFSNFLSYAFKLSSLVDVKIFSLRLGLYISGWWGTRVVRGVCNDHITYLSYLYLSMGRVACGLWCLWWQTDHDFISQGGEGRVWSVVSVVTVSLYLRVVKDVCGPWCLWWPWLYISGWWGTRVVRGVCGDHVAAGHPGGDCLLHL